MYLRTYIQTYKHTDIHTNRHTYKHTNIQTCMHTITYHSMPYHTIIQTIPYLFLVGSNMLPSHPLVPAGDPPSDRWERSHHKSGKERLPCSLQLDGWLKPQPTAVEAKGLVSERSKQGTPGRPSFWNTKQKQQNCSNTDCIVWQHNNPSIFSH